VISDTSDALQHPGDGVFGKNSSIQFDDIEDGTQFTLLVGERSMTSAGKHGAIWMRSINRDGNRGDGAAVTGICRRDVRLNDATQRSGFLSRHPGGVLFAMADGAVRFISNEIESTTYENLAQIRDGNALTELSIRAAP